MQVMMDVMYSDARIIVMHQQIPQIWLETAISDIRLDFSN